MLRRRHRASQTEPRLCLGDGVIPQPGGETHIGDRPVVEGKAGEVTRLLRLPPARLQHPLCVAKAVAVGKCRTEPQFWNNMLARRRIAAPGDLDRSLSDG